MFRKFGGKGFDLTQSDFVEDPYPSYRRQRNSDPVHYIPAVKAWWLTRYSDVVATLTDKRLGKQTAPVVKNRLLQGMFFRDPPAHTRLRSLASTAFTPRTAEALRPRIAEVVREKLLIGKEKGNVDLIRDFAFPIPATIIAEMLGVPASDHERFRVLADRIVQGMDESQTNSIRKDGTEAHSELTDYFSTLIHERRTNQGNDLLGSLIAVKEQGDKLTLSELLSTCVILLVGGHETTANLIGNGILALLTHPEQLELLRDNPKIIAQAVEELLRYDGPFQRVPRIAHEDVEIGGKKVREGEKVFCVLGAANHDPEVFKNPDRLDLRRIVNPHVAFGRGIHMCLGAPLARVEAQVAIGLILNSCPNLALAGKVVWKPNSAVRGLENLPVAL